MKSLLLGLAASGLILAACAPAAVAPADSARQSAPAADAPESSAPEQENAVPNPLPDGPLAPELKNDIWLNTGPLTTADLRGHVVLIDFWTFG
ncbi:MAG TPA: hypothetical protein VJ793_06975 [Anaerolineae bacterium]|nr:hypothetical protein [Anaerolineae bacterium]